MLAFRVFFAVLFGLALPDELKALVRGGERPKADDTALAEARAALAAPAVAAPPVEPPASAPAKPVAPPPAPPSIEDPKRLDGAAIRVLSVLQSEGRLLDFLSEDIEGYGDADVGAAVRDIHKGLRKALADHFPVVPVRSEEEDAPLTIPAGFDPAQIRLVGNVVGQPPFSGRLKHKGWRVTAVHLPRVPAGDAAFVVTPAEVEL